MRLGAIILVGGASRRMGRDKSRILWNGRRAVDRVADLARAVGSELIITAGADLGLPFVLDATPGGGPVGGIVAGATALRAAGCEWALALAVDAPTAEPHDLAPLLGAGSVGAAFEGLHLPLLMRIDAIPPDAAADWSVAQLIERAGLERMAPPSDSVQRLRGANTPRERARLLESPREARSAEKGGAG